MACLFYRYTLCITGADYCYSCVPYRSQVDFVAYAKNTRNDDFCNSWRCWHGSFSHIRDNIYSYICKKGAVDFLRPMYRYCLRPLPYVLDVRKTYLSNVIKKALISNRGFTQEKDMSRLFLLFQDLVFRRYTILVLMTGI